MVKLATFGALCALALLASLCAKKDGQVLRVAASIILGNWLLFAMPWIYAPAAPAFVLGGDNLDAWALADLLSMIAIGWLARDQWWAPAVWSPYLINLSMYAIAWGSNMQYIDYMYVLDAALILQLAVVLAIGGGDCADYLLDRWRNLGGPSRLGGRSLGFHKAKSR